MYISPIDNTNFQSLHVSKKTLKAIGCSKKELLKNSAIRNTSEKYDVLVKPGNGEKTEYINVLSFMATRVATSVFTGGIGGIAYWISIGASNPSFLPFLSSIMLPAIAALGLWKIHDSRWQPKQNILVQAGKGVQEEYGDYYIQRCRTNKYEINDPEETLPDLIDEVKKAENYEFDRQIRIYDTDDLFSAEKYLAALKQADIEALGGGEFFNRPIDDKGNTMITSFFDVLPTEENQKEYSEILDIIKNTKDINYNLRDGGGISCLEKIINSENKQVLPLILGKEFDYAPEIEIVYDNIHDKSFKKEFDKLNLKFNFNDILKAVNLCSYDTLTRLRPQLNSKLCDRKRLAEQIEEILTQKHKKPKNQSDYIADEYVHTYYSEYVNPNKIVRLNKWNNIVDENGDIVNNL